MGDEPDPRRGDQPPDDRPRHGADPLRDDSAQPGARGDVLAELQAEVQELEDDRPPAGGPVHQLVAAAVGLALGVAGAALSWGYGLGTPSAPGPGLWPFLVSLVVAVLSAVLLLTGRRLTDSEAFSRASLIPLVAVLTFLALGLLMPVIGFEVPSLLLCVVWLKLLGRESWRTTAVVSVVTVAAFYALFILLLQVPIPRLL